MVSKVKSGAVSGVDGFIVECEADVSNGLPSFDIVGLPDSAVRESRERVRTAIRNSGLFFPVKKITINLAPADIKKEGPSFDLPIAVSILCCMGIIQQKAVSDVFIIGELSLYGDIRPVSGILPLIHGAYKRGIKKCVVPYENKEEAAMIENLQVTPVKDLRELIGHFDNRPIAPFSVDLDKLEDFAAQGEYLDFSDVKGQKDVKRAMEICAAGGHNILMNGPPGVGKTMMAKRLPTILPTLSLEESIEVTKIYSVAGLLPEKKSLISVSPFRAPHHTASFAAMAGGGKNPRPGEISLSHKGVLFLDELPEFNKNTLEVLRQPLEDGYVTVSRVQNTITYPSEFILVAAMNPCPCGFYTEKEGCTCTRPEINRYLNKISGPLMDRIDMYVETDKIRYNDLEKPQNPESSSEIRKRVMKARAIQRNRYKDENITLNSRLSAAQTDKYCPLTQDGRRIMGRVFDSFDFSARAHHKILKVARTIADLDNSESISEAHLIEAVQYKNLKKKKQRRNY